ncbi:MAG: FlgD immunoglobulin-like domain containing protein [Chitinophagales bacterium]
MKKSARIFLMSIAMFAVTQAKALDLCFYDWWGYVYNVTATKTGPDYWSISGSAQVGAPVAWNVSGYLDRASGTMMFSVTNPAPDGCTMWTDSYDVNVHGLGGGFMHATWVSYCFGSPLFSGTVNFTWAYGACPMRLDGDFAPVGPALSNPESRDAVINLIENNGSILDVLDVNTLNVVNNGDNFSINYSLVDASQNVSIEIYNHVGQLIATVVNGNVQAGLYTATWNGKTTNGDDASTGMYFAVLKSNGESISKKFVK